LINPKHNLVNQFYKKGLGHSFKQANYLQTTTKWHVIRPPFGPWCNSHQNTTQTISLS